MKNVRVVSGVLSLACATCTVSAQFTGPVGSGVSIDNRQPSLAINFAIAEFGVFGTGVPVRLFAFDLPQGWMAADGRLLLKAQFQNLFDQIGATYGGNGVTTFALPDLRGRSPVGAGSSAGTLSYLAGQVVGQDNASIGSNQLAVHRHDLQCGRLTGFAGQSQPLENRQPSQALYWEICKSGIFPSRQFEARPRGSVATPGSPFLAQIFLHTASATISDYLPADGRLLLYSQHTALFSLVGTFYGGNGTTNFAIPALGGRLVTGFGQGPGLSQYALGETFGTDLNTMTGFELPTHSHTVPDAPNTGPAGVGFPMENRQSTIALNYCIADIGVYPTEGGLDDFDLYLGEIIVFAGNFTPVGFQPCDGRLLPINDDTFALWSLLGTRFGGDGVFTFGLPDLRGRVPVGTGPGLPLGTKFGSESTALTEANLPIHAHSIPAVCAGDLNADTHRDTADLVLLLQQFGLIVPPNTCGDINGDGAINTLDLTQFLAKFGLNC